MHILRLAVKLVELYSPPTTPANPAGFKKNLAGCWIWKNPQIQTGLLPYLKSAAPLEDPKQAFFASFQNSLNCASENDHNCRDLKD